LIQLFKIFLDTKNTGILETILSAGIKLQGTILNIKVKLLFSTPQ